MDNNTNIIRKSRIGKTLTGIGLCLSIAFSGSMMLPTHPVHAASVSGSSVADRVISTGKQFLGVRYQFGAPSGRTDEFDCSSFTQYVFKQNGFDLPRSSRQQSQVGTQVSKDQLQQGDLVFSDTNHDGVINHVGIYMGNGEVLHTYRVGIGVTVSNFSGSTWDRTFVTARRVISDNGQASGGQTPKSQAAEQSNNGKDPSSQDSNGQNSADNSAAAPSVSDQSDSLQKPTNIQKHSSKHQWRNSRSADGEDQQGEH
ncbi:C40 family peptidase [Paenibacillus xylanivorans]|uniref:C40 family peptidase n=1 Tax=Paenibacillus xylanivorans TaxID=1705561 RepID=UPI0009EC948B|nr:C40 family peptidase [Paenibacillus xylanivorans]